MTKQIPDWYDYFMDITKTVSQRSNCIRAHVGAIIVGENKHIISSGYNGTPSKVESCVEKGSCYRMDNNIPSGTQYETCRSLHAEMNAIIQAGEDKCKNGSIYIYGHNQICIMCKRFIVQSGLKFALLKKDENSGIVIIPVDELRRELE